ncbi:MAG: DUF4131 domain-containing protein [Acidobacteria bacterium]|nr:DUF4131 domain-containing protein [Acidobacteriota bacterium]
MMKRAVTHKPSFNAYPLVVLAAAFSCGVLLASFSPPPPAPYLIGGVCLTSCAVVAFVKNRLALSSCVAVAAFVCAGAALASIGEARVGETRLRSFYERGQVISGEPLELTGVLERALEVAPDGLLFTLRVERLRRGGTAERAASGRVEFFAPVRDARAGREYEALELRRGARVRVMSSPTRAERYRNPGRVGLYHRRGRGGVGGARGLDVLRRGARACAGASRERA